MLELNEIVDPDTIKRLTNHRYFAQVQSKINLRITRLVNDKLKEVIQYIRNYVTFLNLVLLNSIPLAYLYGKSSVLPDADFWMTFKDEFHIILPFTLISLVLKALIRFTRNISLAVAIIIGAIATDVIFKKAKLYFKTNKSGL